MMGEKNLPKMNECPLERDHVKKEMVSSSVPSNFFRGVLATLVFSGVYAMKKKRCFVQSGMKKKQAKTQFFQPTIPICNVKKKRWVGRNWSTTYWSQFKKKLQKLRSSFIKQHHRNDSQLNEPLRFSGPLSLNRSQDHPPNLVKDMIPVASGKGWDIPGSIVDFWQPGRECNEKTLMQLAHSSSILAQMTSKSEAKWICLDVPGT